MGSDEEGHCPKAAVARKGRKRQLVLESSDSEEDEFCISTRQKAEAAAMSNAGDGVRSDGDNSGEKVVAVGSEKPPRVMSTEGVGLGKNNGIELNRSSSSGEKVVADSSENPPGAKSTEEDGSDKNSGDDLNRSSSQPHSKTIQIETVHGGGGGGTDGSVFKDGTGGKMLRPGFPTWRFEKPEVRAGRVLDEKGTEMKASSGSKVKEPLKREKQMLLKTNQGSSVDSGRQEVIRVQGKSGVLKILPKNNKAATGTGDGSLPKKTKVDGEANDGKVLLKNKNVEKTGHDKILTKGGVLKLLPKNNNKVVMETSGGKLLMKNTRVDEETESGRILTKVSKVDAEIGNDNTSTKNTKVDGESGDDRGLRNCMVNEKRKTGTDKILSRKNKVEGEISEADRRDKKKNSVLDGFKEKDTNGEKRFTEKLVSSITLRKSDPSVVGVSLGQRMRTPQDGHYQASQSLKDGNTKLGEHKNGKKRLLEHKGSPANLSKKAKPEAIELHGTSSSAIKKHSMKMPRTGPRNSIKQKLRDQIKRMLLDNGWKIDLRRRKSKDYEDSVYVSPQGTGYWSITKAYAVFQEQFRNQEKQTDRSTESDNLEPGDTDAPCNTISKDDLAMLQRNVLKRRTKKELRVAEKKYVDSSRDLKDNFTGKSSRNMYRSNGDRIMIKNRGCALLVRGSTHNMDNGMGDYVPYQWKRSVLSWMIDLGVVPEDAKVRYINKKGTHASLEGRITKEGIYCGCCSKILTITKFELHAGSKEQQPYANIFLEDNEISLLQCLLDAWEKQTQIEKKGFYKIEPGDDPDDDTCGICADGGNLICCDLCTSTFHLSCLGIEMPSGDWYCRSCICRFCGSAHDMTSPSTELLSCLQCSRKYHEVCANGTTKDSVSTKPGTSTDCFCSLGCRKICKQLKKLLGVKNDMEAGFSWSLVRCFTDFVDAPPKKKAQLVYCSSKTAVAYSVMDECFLPHIDERSGINIIHNVIYNCGSDFNRLNFSGFYAFILERGDEVISTATVRIHGTDLAEMPFVGTRAMYRCQGMCHRLLDAIESVLRNLNVRRLVIPAIPELQSTWTKVFGFKPVEPSKKQKIKSLNLLIIHGTGLLEKRWRPIVTVNRQKTDGTDNDVGCDKMDAPVLGEANGSLTPAHVSREFSVGGDHETKDNNSSFTGSSAGLTANLSSVLGEKTPQMTSPSPMDDINLHTSPGVCENNMQCIAETEKTQEVKPAETDGISIAENTVAEQKPEDESNSSYLTAIPVKVDQCSRSSNELGKSEHCVSSELSV